MERLDLEAPRFAQAQVLDLVPGLSAKTLQNWLTRGIFQHAEAAPGRQAKRLWSPLGVMALDFMTAVSDLGIGPAVAAELSQTYVERAVVLHDTYPARVAPDGLLHWVERMDHQEFYSRGHIYRFEGRHLLVISNSAVDDVRMFLPHVYLTVEVDRMILVMLNRIYLQVAGKKEEAGALQGTPEEIEEQRKILNFTRKIGPPTGK